MAKITRQAMEVSISELEEKAKELRKESKQLTRDLRIKYPVGLKWQVNIINKTPKCSDTWRFE